MSARDDNRQWLLNGAGRWPDGFEAGIVAEYGLDGALDMLAIQGGNPSGATLTRRPFSGDPELKDAVRAAREAVGEMSRLAYARWWADSERHKAERETNTEAI